MTAIRQPKIHALILLISILAGIGYGSLVHLESMHDFSHIVTEYLLPLFFLAVGIELRAEFTSGHFVNRRNLWSPSLGAVFGVALPGAIFVFVTGETTGSWSIPTATDITLGVAALSVVAVRVSSRLRAKFLALATIDDVIGLLILLTVFSSKLDPLKISLVVTMALLFFAAQRFLGSFAVISAVIPLLAIVVSVGSGVQTSLIGFAFGFLVTRNQDFKWLEQTNGLVILPLFGFGISAVAGSELGGGITATVLVAILLRPAGKILGITFGAWVGSKLSGTKESLSDWFAIGTLGGLGLTVSLLLAQIAYEGNPQSLASAVIGTLLASAISFLLFMMVIRLDRRSTRQVAK